MKALEIKEKAAVLPTAVCIGDPSGTRTRVTAVRGRCPRPLDDGTFCKRHHFNNLKNYNMQEVFYTLPQILKRRMLKQMPLQRIL